MISVIITSFNRIELFEKSFNSIAPQLSPEDEFVVVEEGKSRYWPTYFSLKKVKFQFIHTNNKKYRSCSIAKNIALRCAKGQYIVINDPEVIQVTPCITNFKKQLEVNPRLFIVPGHCYAEKYAGCPIDKCHEFKASQAPFVAMCKKDELMAVGGWDERFVYWGNDDNDLMFRLGNNDCKHFVDNSQTIIHQWHERPPAFACGDYNEPILYEKDKKTVANIDKPWGHMKGSYEYRDS